VAGRAASNNQLLGSPVPTRAMEPGRKASAARRGSRRGCTGWDASGNWPHLACSRQSLVPGFRTTTTQHEPSNKHENNVYHACKREHERTTTNIATKLRGNNVRHLRQINVNVKRMGASSGNWTRALATRAPVEDGFAETGVHVPSPRARHLARRPQPPERLERGGPTLPCLAG